MLGCVVVGADAVGVVATFPYTCSYAFFHMYVYMYLSSTSGGNKDDYYVVRTNVKDKGQIS